MKRNIISILFGFIALVAMTASCNKFLSEKPQTFVSPDNYYKTEAEIQAVVNGCYLGLNSIFNGLVGVQLTGYIQLEGLTGLCWREQAGREQDMGFILPLLETNGVNIEVWRDYYASIENCNSTIYGILNSDCQLAEAVKNKFLGEVYALRGYYYYRLATLFGPVPYKTERTTGVADAQLVPTPVADILDGVVKDLQEAERYFEGTAYNPGDGHIGLGAVKSILAKVYLTMAGYPVCKTENYAKAYEKAKEVKDSGAYSLFAEYSYLRDGAHENMGEVIFSLQREAERAGSGMHIQCLPITNPKIAMGADLAGGFVPLQSFYDSFSDADARKTAFFYTSYPAMDGSGIMEFPPHVFKFFDESAIESGKCGEDCIVIRYADVLLTLAEAACAGGSTSDRAALEAYDLVHKRAIASDPMPSTLTFDMVFKERVKELCFENQTWFDMLRTRKAYNPITDSVVDMLGYHPEGHNRAFQEEDLYWIIPVRERRLNPNLK